MKYERFEISRLSRCIVLTDEGEAYTDTHHGCVVSGCWSKIPKRQWICRPHLWDEAHDRWAAENMRQSA